jgi:hypothetical protein
MKKDKNYATVGGRLYAQNKAISTAQGKLFSVCDYHGPEYTHEGRSLTWRVNVLTLTTGPKSFVSA